MRSAGIWLWRLPCCFCGARDEGCLWLPSLGLGLIIELRANPEVMSRLEKLLAFERAMDTVVWQLLASVACPGYTIHTVVALVHAALLPVEVCTLDTRRLVLMHWSPYWVCGGY